MIRAACVAQRPFAWRPLITRNHYWFAKTAKAVIYRNMQFIDDVPFRVFRHVYLYEIYRMAFLQFANDGSAGAKLGVPPGSGGCISIFQQTGPFFRIASVYRVGVIYEIRMGRKFCRMQHQQNT